MPESPDIPEEVIARIRDVIPEEVIARIRDVIPYSPPVQQPGTDRNEPMPYQRPDGKDLIDGEDERGFAVTPVPKSTSGTIGSFVGQVSVSPDTLLNDFPDDMDGQTPKILSVSDATKIYAHATVSAGGAVAARVIAAAASVPASDPASGEFYWELASVTMATDGEDNVPVITVDQIRWGPIEHLVVNCDPYSANDARLVIEAGNEPLAIRQIIADTGDLDAGTSTKYTSDFLIIAEDGNAVKFSLTHEQVEVVTGIALISGYLEVTKKKVWVLLTENADNTNIPTTPSATTACP